MIGLQNKTRYITYRDAGVPQITNNYGALASMLKTVLTTGFNFKTILSFSLKENNTVDIEVESGHGFQTESVIKIANSSVEEFNDCFRVLNVKGNTVTIGFTETVSSLPVVSETLSICTAPLGYDIVYENTASTTICFENKAITSKGILKVIDEIPPNGYSTSWVKFARVVAGREIDASGNFIDNIKTPYNIDYPDAENTGNGSTIYGHAKWYYAFHNYQYADEDRAPEGTFPRKWEIIGDDKTFYLFLYNNDVDSCNCGFGSYFNSKGSGGIVLQASDSFVTPGTNDVSKYGKKRAYWGTLLNSAVGSFVLPNDFFNKNTISYYGVGLLLGSSYVDRPWLASDIKNYNSFTGLMTTSKLHIRSVEGFLYGYHRGLDIFYGTGHPKEGRLLSTTYRIINMTDPVRSGADMPLMFNMQDWEDV